MNKELIPDGTPKRSTGRWLKWLSLIFVLLVAAGVGGHWWWGQSAERRLDAMIARYRASGEPMLPSDLVAPSVPDDQNAVIDLRAAAALIDTKSDAWDSYGRLDPALPLTDREIAVLKRVLAEGQGALAKARQATTKSGVDWQMQFPSPMLQNLDPDLNRQRSLANLLAAAALYAHHEGDDAGAVRRIRELLFVSRAVGQKPTLISGLVSRGIAGIATHRLQQITPDLSVAPITTAGAPDGRPATPEQVQALLTELLDSHGPMEDQKRAWRGERVSQLDTMQALVEGRLDVTSPGARPGPNGVDRSNAFTGYVMRPLFMADAQLMADYMAGMISAGEAPNLPAARGKRPAAVLNEVTQHRSRHMFAAMLLPSMDRAQSSLYQHLAERRLASVAVAARWYAVDHDGALPARLDDLCPRYLPSPPLDPLAAGGTLRYLPGRDDPIVYSVGQNATDEGGSEKPTGKRRPEVEWEMEDRVLHLKRQPRPAPEPDETNEPEGLAPDGHVPATALTSRPALPPPYGG